MNQQIVELYQAVAGRLLKYLVANGCAEAQAEDIVQKTFLRLLKMSGELEADRRNRLPHGRERVARQGAHLPREGEAPAAAQGFDVTFRRLVPKRG